ncbi:MAG: swr complex subunit [Geoglossum umbratile]|nr:MAG: swr complex subunit [Geoglossum umbratile]
MVTNPIDSAAPPAAEPDLDSSGDDEDFNPDAIPSAANADGLSSDSDSDFTSSEATTEKPRGKKRKQANEGGELELEFASGDEATILKGKRKKQKKAKGAAADSDQDDDDDGGEGGLIKTRAQRAREKKEKKPLASAANATIDVDALWASMNTSTTGPKPAQTPAPTASQQETSNANGAETSKDEGMPSKQPSNQPLDKTITIHRTYTFAGQTTTESQTVPKSSAAARLYLQSQSQPQPQPPHPSQKPPLRRPKKRTSLFDPAAPGAAAQTAAAKAPKLNTIEKSKMDWAGYVDREGLKEDLDEHSKAKEGYLGRMDFLGRVERKREEEGRRARGLGS